MHPHLERARAEDTPILLEDACEVFGEALPLLLELADTPQDPEWHAEGDVAVHTSMVIEAFEGQLATADWALDEDERLLGRLSALLHDIAKPMTTTTRTFDGVTRVVAPRHGDRGASALFLGALSMRLPDAMFDALLGLVAYHHDPKLLVIKDRPEEAFWRLARHVDPRLVYLLEQADMRGRLCPDQPEQIELIDLFRVGCEAFGVWEDPAAPHRALIRHVREAFDGQPEHVIERALMEGVWDRERRAIFTPEEAVSRAWPLRERGCPEVVVTCGLSGSGKTTLARMFYPEHEIVSMDALREEITGDAADQSQNGRVFQLARERLRESLRAGQDVIWDATNLRRDQRRAIVETAHDYGGHSTLLVVQCAVDTAQRRNRERARTIPASIIARQARSLEWPTRDEAHRVLVVDADGATRSDTRRWWLT